METELLKGLLYEDEGASLDFKRDQYPFSNATDREKSELLKDLLAMANAWRDGAAHILIGVKEVRGGRSQVVGESDHPQEHNLQQFVNSKTNRPVEFSYEVEEIDGKQVGVFRIPEQDRPVFAESDYGKVDAETVYLRRGSATATADPSEIAKMGSAGSGSPEKPPHLTLEWADIQGREPLGRSVVVNSLHLHPHIDPNSLKPRVGPQNRLVRGVLGANPSYYEDLVEFVYRDALLSPLGFRLEHLDGPVARSVEVVAEIERADGVVLVDSSDSPREPDRHSPVDLSAVAGPSRLLGDRPSPKVSEHPDHWEVTIPFGDLAPRRSRWSSDSVYVGAVRPAQLEFTATLYSEDLPQPEEVELKVEFDVEERKMCREDVEPFLKKR